METIENMDFKQVYVTHYTKMKNFAKEYVLSIRQLPTARAGRKAWSGARSKIAVKMPL